MKTQPYRLDGGSLIDRERSLSFQFNGKSYQGYAGDSLASALLANGVIWTSRSFKYHRPRGIYSAGAEEPNALMQLERGAHTQPNPQATLIELYDRLVADSANCWPALKFDISSINDYLSPFLPAAFYYKTFMWPRALWHSYEWIIRKAAGIGKAHPGADPDSYDKLHAFCDVLVAGSGAAGLTAALAAGRCGARVILADLDWQLAAHLSYAEEEIDGKPAKIWRSETLSELQALPNVTLLPRTTVFGYYDHNYLLMAERLTDHFPIMDRKGPRQRLWRLRAKEVVLATGAFERPLVFPNNDRPGIMLASAAEIYRFRYGVAAGKNAVIVTNNDEAYQRAYRLHQSGVNIRAIVDLREISSGPFSNRMRQAGVEIFSSCTVLDSKAGDRVREIEIAPHSGGEVMHTQRKRLSCDILLVSGGYIPNVHLFSQSQGKLRFDARLNAFLPDQPGQAHRPCGAARGVFGLAECLIDGFQAGQEAAAAAGAAHAGSGAPPKCETEAGLSPHPAFWQLPCLKSERRKKRFVDFHNDVTVDDLALAQREGYQSIEHTKRYTTLGLAPDQGKFSSINAYGIVADMTGRSVGEVGTTTFRPAYSPVPMGLFGGIDKGQLIDPIRKTPLHDWHAAQSAPFENVGAWHRAWYYPKSQETFYQAVQREVVSARLGVGIFDASTLGKIDLQGPDVRTLLNRVYTNAWTKLAPGRCRYGLMLGEDGMVMDDGVTTCLSDHHFHMTTTTGAAARIFHWLERWLQCEWTDLEVYCSSVTEQWANIILNGPMARRLLAELVDDIDLAAGDFPFMSMQDGHIRGLPVRIFRISFTGELSFEINVAPSYALTLWQWCMEAGEKYQITPYGTEALHVLRAEKGFIIVGQETDGAQTPGDLGMDWIVSTTKGDFIGKRSLSRSDTARSDRKHLVGLLPVIPSRVLPEGGQIIDIADPRPPVPMLGHVTSSYFSPNLGRSFALALLANGRARMGQTLYIPWEDQVIAAVVTEPRFFDVEGRRIDG